MTLTYCLCAQVVAADGVIYMVLEYGDIDLARLLAKQEGARRDQAAAGAHPDENFIRLYWQQMLQARACMNRRARGAVSWHAGQMARGRSAVLSGMQASCMTKCC